MKKILLTIALVSAVATVNAQTEEKKETQSEGYNRWSVELNGGVNKPSAPFAPGYFTSTPNLWNADFGVRYMFNNKFGLKADIGYYKFENKDDRPEFKTQYYRAAIQGVVNAGRILNFESFTKSIGLLAHMGGGYAQFKTDDHDFTDRMGNFIIGLTAQFKVTDRVVINGDFTSVTGVGQSRTFDGTMGTGEIRGFAGGIYSGTIGLTVYLGKNAKHADWFVDSDKTKDEMENLQKRIGDLETMLNDTDKDGVPDYLDAEPNTTAGVAVDSKGKAVDTNNNGVPDELEGYLEKTYGDAARTNINNNNNVGGTNNELIRNLINEGYVTTYFDFNKTKPTNVSTEGIDFILTYLRNNPTESVDIIGHADELGKSAYNEGLANKRANAVKAILVNAKIDPARLNIVSAGEDSSVAKESPGARKLVRRVTFRVK